MTIIKNSEIKKFFGQYKVPNYVHMLENQKKNNIIKSWNKSSSRKGEEPKSGNRPKTAKLVVIKSRTQSLLKTEKNWRSSGDWEKLTKTTQTFVLCYEVITQSCRVQTTETVSVSSRKLRTEKKATIL